MALKNLSHDEMLQVSAGWVDPKTKAHKAILAQPDLKPSLARLSSAHADLALAAQPVASNSRIAEISAREGSLDARHDIVIRASYALLGAFADLLQDAPQAQELLTLRDLLLPDGLRSTTKSYRAEAGQAGQLASRLTPGIRSQLDSLLVGPKGSGRPLSAFIDEWIALGKQLGELEDERGRLPSPSPDAPSASATLLASRNQWVRVVNAFIANGAVAELDPETDRLIFGPLRDAEKRAARRARTTTAKDPPAPPTDGTASTTDGTASTTDGTASTTDADPVS